ncbi:peptide chain release factor N(5)-glutamine methyltransferase [Agrobacterium larrymoorei]|uniref:Release factor glutamine methyltransferase n=1 Tax=Agrobacterium larrymoorei TaxID=160699 RepID=A0AAF0HB71_9HYPH|nr:peptide chain release factor N(5)-glutamine methyltransferase [Agrobacterium larrymoorei]WHA42833.1 peptide chain release factor N(5)-glutamine methyltransferase [Agrobacterium larrymoorei]
MSTDRTVQACVANARQRLTTAGVADPLTDARVLIGEVLGFSLTDFVLNGARVISDDEAKRIEPMIARRERGEPVHRILGHREFYGLDFLLSPGTLEPRPDTEVLVDAVLPHLRRVVSEKGSTRILDMGIGTGAICISLLHAVPGVTGVGSDISQDALMTAGLNAERHGLGKRFETVMSDWFKNISGRFDIILSNPPYIRTDVIDTLDREVREFDPLAALDGGADGLLPYRIIAEKAVDFLENSGVVGVEIGYDQMADVTAIFASNGYDCIDRVKDYGGNDRALIFRR